MKNLLVLLAVVFMLVPGFTEEEQQTLTPETVVYIDSPDGVRVVTAGDMWNELGSYEDTAKVTHNAYYDGEKFVVPMIQTEKDALQQQQEEFNNNTTSMQHTEETLPRNPERGEYFEEASYNQKWGVDGILEAYLDALARISGGDADRSFHAHFYGGGVVFSKDIRIIHAEANLRNEGGVIGSGNVEFKILTYTVLSQSFNEKLQYSLPLFNIEKTISKWFTIGVIPVNVSFTIGGEAGIVAALSIIEGGVQGGVTPRIVIYGSAEATVNIVIAKAGVKIGGPAGPNGDQLLILEDRLPIYARAQLLSNMTLQFSLIVRNELEALKGHLVVFAAIMKLTGGWKNYEKVLFDWTGIEKIWTIYDKKWVVDLN